MANPLAGVKAFITTKAKTTVDKAVDYMDNLLDEVERERRNKEMLRQAAERRTATRMEKYRKLMGIYDDTFVDSWWREPAQPVKNAPEEEVIEGEEIEQKDW